MAKKVTIRRKKLESIGYYVEQLKKDDEIYYYVVNLGETKDVFEIIQRPEGALIAMSRNNFCYCEEVVITTKENKARLLCSVQQHEGQLAILAIEE